MGSLDDLRNEDSREGTGRDGVAIIGMSCLFPSAPDVDAYWRNILGSFDAISDPPPGSWDVESQYNPTRPDRARSIARRGATSAN